eukprot:comp20826_c0_seq1/m.43107 comp20826_c0_seq1/g.43107  ORF comp20826_c0_seq1/g.43107 comp20826_c0_seq1/m.43107 type:complete len:307 (-) comp20826_c0_seq1:434-1354(-)
MLRLLLSPSRAFDSRLSSALMIWRRSSRSSSLMLPSCARSPELNRSLRYGVDTIVSLRLLMKMIEIIVPRNSELDFVSSRVPALLGSRSDMMKRRAVVSTKLSPKVSVSTPPMLLTINSSSPPLDSYRIAEITMPFSTLPKKLPNRLCSGLHLPTSALISMNTLADARSSPGVHLRMCAEIERLSRPDSANIPSAKCDTCSSAPLKLSLMSCIVQLHACVFICRNGSLKISSPCPNSSPFTSPLMIAPASSPSETVLMSSKRSDGSATAVSLLCLSPEPVIQSHHDVCEDWMSSHRLLCKKATTFA